LLRGVSGGERKRVTLGEMILASRIGYFMDEISTGLFVLLFAIVSVAFVHGPFIDGFL
jgi:Fe-S cluster assembly ATPase SufC